MSVVKHACLVGCFGGERALSVLRFKLRHSATFGSCIFLYKKVACTEEVSRSFGLEKLKLVLTFES